MVVEFVRGRSGAHAATALRARPREPYAGAGQRARRPHPAGRQRQARDPPRARARLRRGAGAHPLDPRGARRTDLFERDAARGISPRATSGRCTTAASSNYLKNASAGPRRRASRSILMSSRSATLRGRPRKPAVRAGYYCIDTFTPLNAQRLSGRRAGGRLRADGGRAAASRPAGWPMRWCGRRATTPKARPSAASAISTTSAIAADYLAAATAGSRCSISTTTTATARRISSTSATTC